MSRPELTESADLPLTGVRVVDFSWVAAGPNATRILAEFGAEVILVESANRSGGFRGQPPVPPGRSGPNANTWFNNCNVSKLSITLDLADERGPEIVRRLIERSDVVLDNFRPGVMEKWGLDHERLLARQPELIVVTMPMLGSTGPHRRWGGFAGAALSLSGVQDLTGFADGPPLTYAGAFSDNSVPFHAALAVLAALYSRELTGQGQWIDLSQVESTMALIGPEILDATVNGHQVERSGNQEELAAPCGMFRCRGEDAWCAIEVHLTEQWVGLCRAIDRLDLLGDARFETAHLRFEHREALQQAVERWIGGLTADEAARRLQAAGVPAAPYRDAPALLEDPHLAARSHFVTIDHPEAGPVVVQQLGFRLSQTPARITRAPLLGEHNQVVLSTILGLSDDEIAALIEQGVVA